ncbi:jockey\pol [Symbiodinium sp. CCMP2592]|nr:jockey\pol [Symbiodinium sp. CCMP2592]
MELFPFGLERKQPWNNGGKDSQRSKSKGKGFGGGCAICGDLGHWKNECPKARGRVNQIRRSECLRERGSKHHSGVLGALVSAPRAQQQQQQAFGVLTRQRPGDAEDGAILASIAEGEACGVDAVPAYFLDAADGDEDPVVVDVILDSGADVSVAPPPWEEDPEGQGKRIPEIDTRTESVIVSMGRLIRARRNTSTMMATIAAITLGQAEELDVVNSKITLKDQTVDLQCQLHTPLCLHHALHRRALAMDLAGVASYSVSMEFHEYLMSHLTMEPPPGYHQVTLHQVLAADRAAWLRLAEKLPKGLRAGPDGKLPLDVELPKLQVRPEGGFASLTIRTFYIVIRERSLEGGQGNDSKIQRTGGKGKGRAAVQPPLEAGAREVSTCVLLGLNDSVGVDKNVGRCLIAAVLRLDLSDEQARELVIQMLENPNCAYVHVLVPWMSPELLYTVWGLRILSYNCGGLTSALYTELLVWLKMHRPDVVFLQETHWSEDRALLLVKAHCHNGTHYLINIYQKVHDGTKECINLRSEVWDALQKAIATSPSRHSLIIAGDFNTSLQHRAPCTGTAVITKGNAAEAQDAHVLQQLVKQFDLRALNTFQPTPCKHTYQHQTKTEVRSQTDYILIRGRRTDSLAKQTTTLIDTDLGAWRGGPKHWPLLASIPADCFYSSCTPAQENEARYINTQVRQGKLLLGDVEEFQAAVHGQEELQTWFLAQRRRVRRTTAMMLLSNACGSVKRQAFIDERVSRATQVNKIAPKVVRRQPQLRDVSGCIITPEQETQTLRDYWQQIYCSHHPRTPAPLHQYHLPEALLRTALASLSQHKALPSHYAPGLAWKSAAASVSALAERTILQDWRHDHFWIPPEWRHAWLCLILKAGKTGRKAEEYRPIGLTDPVGKPVLGAVHRQHHRAVYDSVAPYPQFAYLPRRGVSQALMRAFQHLHQAREVVAQQRLTLQQRHAGQRRQQLAGAITVSLDLSKAFDSLEPEFMHKALEMSCLPPEVCRLIENWHHGIIYHIEHEQCRAQINCNRGIRQGCAISPRVWSLFTILIMSEMGPEWSQRHSTWFADDALFQAMVRSETELHQQLKTISKALWVLQKLGLSIAPTKCAVLLHLGGTAVPNL